MPHELLDGKVPTDKEFWKQCHYCGRVYPKYEQKYQSELGETVQTSDNPHDIGGYITGANPTTGKTLYEKERVV